MLILKDESYFSEFFFVGVGGEKTFSSLKSFLFILVARVLSFHRPKIGGLLSLSEILISVLLFVSSKSLSPIKGHFNIRSCYISYHFKALLGSSQSALLTQNIGILCESVRLECNRYCSSLTEGGSRVNK